MKRSDAVRLLANSFFKHMNGLEAMTDDEVYSNILADLEKVGVMPPQYIYEYDGFTMSKNRWEDEDKKS